MQLSITKLDVKQAELNLMGNIMNKIEPSAEHQALSVVWKQTRAAINGKLGVVSLIDSNECNKGYLGLIAPNANTNDPQYQKKRQCYFSRGRFSNFTGRTHDSYLGLIGSKEAEVKLPSGIDGMNNDCDGGKTTLHDFSLALASELLITARAGILSEPPNTAGETRDKMTLPKLVMYKAEQIFNPIMIDGELVQLDLVEFYYALDKDEYELKEQTRRLRLNEAGNYESIIYRDGDECQRVEAIVNGSPLKYIPFQFAGAENNKASYDRPVMFDLAHQNIGHFQLDCEVRNNLHYHLNAVVNVFVSDATAFAENNPAGFTVGADGRNVFQVGERAELMQMEANGAGPNQMKADEAIMIMLGAQVVQSGRTNKTLGAEIIESNASMSQLKRISINTSAAITQALEWCAEFVSANPDDIEFKVNDKFVTDDMGIQDLVGMFNIFQGDGLPQSVLFEVARKAGFTEKENEELLREIEEKGMGGDNEEVAALKMELDNLREEKLSNG